MNDESEVFLEKLSRGRCDGFGLPEPGYGPTTDG